MKLNDNKHNVIMIRVPLHVSGLWFPSINKNPLYTGSLGAGVNLSLYLEAQLEKESQVPRIVLNNKDVLRSQAEFLCRKYGLCISIRAYSPIDLGIGFGVSAACLIAYSIISSIIQDKNITLEKATWPAHVAEVYYKTGLGDVISEFYGGAEIRIKPGPPGIGSVERILLRKNYEIISVVLKGKEFTPNMLSRIRPEYYREKMTLLNKLLDDPSLENFFELAHEFTRNLFSYNEIDQLINRIKNKIISYYRKKQALLILPEHEWIPDIIKNFESLGLRVFNTKINHIGVEIVYSPKSSS